LRATPIFLSRSIRGSSKDNNMGCSQSEDDKEVVRIDPLDPDELHDDEVHEEEHHDEEPIHVMSQVAIHPNSISKHRFIAGYRGL
jgi:hypothetical protein